MLRGLWRPILQECCPCQPHLLLLGARRQLTICSFFPVEELSKSPGERGCLNSFLPTQTDPWEQAIALVLSGGMTCKYPGAVCARARYRRGVSQGPCGMLIPFLTSTSFPVSLSFMQHPNVQPWTCSCSCWDMGWSCSSWGFGDMTSISCSSLYSLLSIVTLARANLRKKGFIWGTLPCCSPLLKDYKRTGQELKQKVGDRNGSKDTWGSVAHWFALHGSLSLLAFITQDHLSKGGTACVDQNQY